MECRKMTVSLPGGLHARSAMTFTQTAARFSAEIQVEHQGRQANGKSMVAVLTLGAAQGAEVTLRIEGEDEREAMEALEELLQGG